MSKKPPLTLVEPDGTTVPPPPRDLGKPGRALWDAVQREFDVSDVCGVELLAQACSALTKAEALHAEIERDGPVLRDRRGIKDHGAEARISQQGFRGADVDAARVEFRAAAQRGRQARGATWMTSKRTTRTRHPHKPTTPEILKLFDRALAGDKAVKRELQIHAARIFGPRWSFGCPTPADPCFDGPPIIDSPANWLHQNWPLLQADRRKLLAAHAAWKATAA